MGVTEMIHGSGQTRSHYQFSYAPAAECSSLAVVTGFLDSALRMWDSDRIEAKSQVKVAAAILRACKDDSEADRKHAAIASDRPVLAPWQRRRVKEFIDASLESSIGLRDCASQARLSASYFAQTFKATFGMTVCHYIRRRRIAHAQQLMLLSTEPLSQIALACGFANQAHYCRVFRDVVGLSPNAWRHSNMNLAPDESTQLTVTQPAEQPATPAINLARPVHARSACRCRSP
jgi:AraC family transcriptional regulator